MAKSEMQFGMIKIIIEDEKSSNAVDVTNLAFNALTQLIPQAKEIAQQEREEIAKNMKLLKGKAECDNCEDCSDDCEECGHPKKDLEIKNLYV